MNPVTAMIVKTGEIMDLNKLTAHLVATRGQWEPGDFIIVTNDEGKSYLSHVKYHDPLMCQEVAVNDEICKQIDDLSAGESYPIEFDGYATWREAQDEVKAHNKKSQYGNYLTMLVDGRWYICKCRCLG